MIPQVLNVEISTNWDEPLYKISLIEDHPHKIWYSLDGGKTNISVDFSRLNTYTIIDQDLWHEFDYGMINITFYAEDVVGNFAFIIIEIEKIPEYYYYDTTDDNYIDNILVFGFYGLLITIVLGTALLYRKFSRK